MSQAGYQKAIQVKTTANTSWDPIPGSAASMSFAGEMLDDTDFTSTGWHSRIRGLKDYSFSVTAFYGTTLRSMTTIRSALLSGASLDIRYLPNGTAGFTGRVKVETLSHSGDVGGLESIDISLQSEGIALTTV